MSNRLVWAHRCVTKLDDICEHVYYIYLHLSMMWHALCVSCVSPLERVDADARSQWGERVDFSPH